MKKLFLIPLTIVLVSGLIFGGCAAPAPAPAPAPPPKPAEPIVIKAVSFLPKMAMASYPMKVLADKVNTAAKGELVIDYVGGPEVISGFDQGEAVKSGQIDMSLLPTIFYADIVPEGYGAHLSEFKPWEERKNGYYDFMQEMHKEKMNAYYLGENAPYLPFHLFTNKKADRPQELKGQKIAVTLLYIPFMAALGVAPVTIPVPDIYSAVDRGLVNGYCLPPASAADMSLWEVTKYMIDPGFYDANNCVFVINLDKWNGIPKNLQDIMTNAQIELEREMEAHFIDHYKVEGRQKMFNGGVELITFSSEDAKWYRELAYSSSWGAFKEKVSPDNFAKLRGLMLKNP